MSANRKGMERLGRRFMIMKLRPIWWNGTIMVELNNMVERK